MQPYINVISNYDAKNSYTIAYTYLGSERIITNEVQIREAIDKSKPVYTRTSTKFDKNHEIPKDSLINGKTYLAKIRVEIEDNWSDWSPEIEFTCLATPVLLFDNLDEKNFVYNNDVMMTVLYRQEQGERVKTFQFTLMDQNKVPITKYPTRLPDEMAPNILKERMDGLIKGRLYYVGCRIITRNGINYFETHEFIPHFVAPSLEGIVSVQNQSESGQILVQSYLKQMLGTQTKPFIPSAANDSPSNYTFLNNEWVIIPPEMPLMYTRLGMAKASDWVTKLWCKNVLNGVMLDFSKEFGEGIHVKFIKFDDYIVCEKEHMNIKSRTRSNVVKGLKLKNFYLYIKVIEFRIEMQIVPMDVVVMNNDFKHTVAGSHFGVANIAKESYQTESSEPGDGKEFAQSRYREIGTQWDGATTRLATTDLNGRAQAVLSFDMIGKIQEQFGDVAWGGKESLADKVRIARKVVERWEPHVYAKSTSPEGDKTTMEAWAGSWNTQVSHSTNNFEDLSYVGGSTSTAFIDDKGFINLHLFSQVSDGKVPAELLIDYASLITWVNPQKF